MDASRAVRGGNRYPRSQACVFSHRRRLLAVDGALLVPQIPTYAPLREHAFVSEADEVSLYYLDLVAINPKREELRTEPVRVLLDTGAENSWLPARLLAGIGIHPRRRKAFRSADGRVIVRDVGYCILAAEGFETNDEIVFAESGDMYLLGVRTLEGFGVSVDPVAHRLIERPLIVAGMMLCAPPVAHRCALGSAPGRFRRSPRATLAAVRFQALFQN